MTSFFEYTHSEFRVLQIPIFEDNYVYLLCDSEHAVVVDPGHAQLVIEVLEQEKLKPIAIINTHHHFDHVDGNAELAARWNCPVYAGMEDQHRIPGIQHKLVEGDCLELGPFYAEIFFTPGHTSGHIAYYFEEQDWLFSGDTLFSLGCGRLYEGTPQQMHNSLSKLRKLPENTLVFCTHEYTKSNLKFSHSILPGDESLRSADHRVQHLLEKNKPTVPMLLGDEIKSNLFLRWDDLQLREHLGLQSKEDWQVFAEIRKRKDHFS